MAISKYIEKFTQLAASGTFWTVVGGVIGIAALGISAYQIVQAADLQRESAEIDRRTKMSELALSAHEAAYAYIAVIVATPKLGPLLTGEIKPPLAGMVIEPDISMVPNELRVATITLNGAVSRALLVDDRELMACLIGLRQVANTLSELTIPRKQNIDAGKIIETFEEVPLVIQRYISGESAPEKFAQMDEELISGSDCGEFAELFGIL